MSGLLTAVIVAGVVAYLLAQGRDPLQVEASSVAAVSPGQACDTTVDVVGTINTNGRPGTVRYQWLRNDGQPTAVLSQSVPAGSTTVPVHMQWSLSGQGRFVAQARLRVLDPGPTESVGGFTYSCS